VAVIPVLPRRYAGKGLISHRTRARGSGVVGRKQEILDAKMRGRWQTRSRLDLKGPGTEEFLEISAPIRVFRYNRPWLR
jgi:hypothetical protein